MFNVIISMQNIAKCHTFKTAFTIFFTEMQKKFNGKEVLTEMGLDTCWIEDTDWDLFGGTPLKIMDFKNACRWAMVQGYLTYNENQELILT